MEVNTKFIRTCELDEQVEYLSKASGISKDKIRTILQHQRRHVQNKLKLGYGYNLKGIVKIMPKRKGEEIILYAKVAQAVQRPNQIRYIEANKSPQELDIDFVDEKELYD